MATEEAKSFCLNEFRDAKMVDKSEHRTERVFRFLKPCAMSVRQASTFPKLSRTMSHNGQKAHPYPKVYFKGWKNPQKKWCEWVEAMCGKHGYNWNQTGICDALLSSMFEVRCNNQSLILFLVEYWCPETNTFVFPWGEATITLEDVMVLGGFSVLGENVNLPLKGEMLEMEKELHKLRSVIIKGKSKKPSHGSWMKFFMEEELESHDLEHVGFLCLWLSRFVFPSVPDCIVGTHVFPIAIRLSSGTRVALAPAVLASLYENLRFLKQQVTSSKEEPVIVLGLFQLVLLWAIERFPILAPECPIELKPGEPRPARWHRLVSYVSNSGISQALKSAENFDWRPYAADLNNWCFVSPYKDTEQLVNNASNSAEEFRSFGKCLCADELVGLGGCVEKYMPHRVAMQFGMDQHFPGEFAVMDQSCKGKFSFYVPSRSYQPCVLLEYHNWFKESYQVQEKEIVKPHYSNLSCSVHFGTALDRIHMLQMFKMPRQHCKESQGLIAFTEKCSNAELSVMEESNEVESESSEIGKQKHAAGACDNPLDVEDYVCTNVGTFSHPIDIDKYI